MTPQTIAPFKRPIRGYIKELLFFMSGRIKIFLVGNGIFSRGLFFCIVSQNNNFGCCWELYGISEILHICFAVLNAHCVPLGSWVIMETGR